jgi:7-cyano-7-deazaguanosine (preQ0) biosynthesis protein QueE
MGRIQALAVNEIFGPTFQGEGERIGRPVVFLRLAGCNLACSWCDTPYAWDWAKYNKTDETTLFTVAELIAELGKLPNRNLVISGGEPMLQQRALRLLTSELHYDGWHTEIETAGTIIPDTVELVRHWTVSPKLENSGNEKTKRLNRAALEVINLAPSRAFKFVVDSLGDLREVDEIVGELSLRPVYIMPEGVTAEKVIATTEVLAPHVVERGYNLTTRLQVLVYGNARAV